MSRQQQLMYIIISSNLLSCDTRSNFFFFLSLSHSQRTRHKHNILILNLFCLRFYLNNFLICINFPLSSCTHEMFIFCFTCTFFPLFYCCRDSWGKKMFKVYLNKPARFFFSFQNVIEVCVGHISLLTTTRRKKSADSSVAVLCISHMTLIFHYFHLKRRNHSLSCVYIFTFIYYIIGV